MKSKEVIEQWLREIHRAEYVDDDYCDNIEVSFIRNTVEVLLNQQRDIKKLLEKIETIISIIKDVEAESRGLFGNNFVKDILLQIYKIDKEE